MRRKRAKAFIETGLALVRILKDLRREQPEIEQPRTTLETFERYLFRDAAEIPLWGRSNQLAGGDAPRNAVDRLVDVLVLRAALLRLEESGSVQAVALAGRTSLDARAGGHRRSALM